jgi:hypothetical protein
VDRLLDRIGPCRGWSKGSEANSRMLTYQPTYQPIKRKKTESRMLTAESLLSNIEQSVETIKSLQRWSMVETIIDALQKEIPPKSQNASLAFDSLGDKPSHIERLLHVRFALYHRYACYGSDDPVERSSNPEGFRQGKLPEYCEKVKADISIMRRGITRGSKTDYLQIHTKGPGITILVAPTVTSLDRVSWMEIQRVPTLIEEKPSLLKACHDLDALAFNIGAIYK